MPFNPTQHRAHMVAHYTKFGQLPAWKQYVSHALKQMEQESPGMYGGIHNEVNQAIKAKQAESVLSTQGDTHAI